MATKQPSSLISSGTVLGTCIDGFLFGACCRLPELNKDGEVIEDIEEIPQEETENEDDKVDITVESEPSALNETAPTALSELLSKSDLSDSEINEIAINPTDASHDDLKDPDVLDSLGSIITTKIHILYIYFMTSLNQSRRKKSI